VPPLTGANALTMWQFAPLVSAPLTVLAAAYLGGVRIVGRRHPARPWPAIRTAAFLLGLAVIAVATQSSIGAYDDVLFSVHMIQHLLLIMVAPPLLVFGRPVTLLLHAARNPLHTHVKRVLRSPVVSGLTRPPVAVTLYAAVVAGTHLTPLMNLVLENEAVHDAEHALFLVAGYLYFLPVAGSEPVRPRLSVFERYLLLLIAMPVDTLVGLVLMIVPRELFPAYARAGRTWGPGLVTDLHQGGLIMFAGGDLIMAVLAVILAVRFVGAGGASRSDLSDELAAYNARLGAPSRKIPSGAAPVARPHAGPAEQPHQGRHQHGPDDDRVEDHSDAHQERGLPELLQRDHRQHRETRREGRARGRYRARGPRRGHRHRVAHRTAPALFPDAPHYEDVVVGAEGHQEHAAGDGHEVHEAAEAQEVTSDQHRQAQAGEHGQDAGGQQVHRREERAQE
jgi:cytochrome c oxidase assembly factor CtaG